MKILLLLQTVAQSRQLERSNQTISSYLTNHNNPYPVNKSQWEQHKAQMNSDEKENNYF